MCGCPLDCFAVFLQILREHDFALCVCQYACNHVVIFFLFDSRTPWTSPVVEEAILGTKRTAQLLRQLRLSIRGEARGAKASA